MARMTLPAINAAMEPTDRSMPPDTMTKHMPTAMMPMKAVRVSTLVMLSSVAKLLLSKVPTTHSSTRPITGPMPCSLASHWPACDAAGAAALVSSCGMGDELLFGELLGFQNGLQAARTHHRHAVAQANELHEFAGNNDDGQALAGQLLDE